MKKLFEVSRLSRRKIEVKQHDLRVPRFDKRFKFEKFAATEAERDVASRSTLDQFADRLDGSGLRQSVKLRERIVAKTMTWSIDPDKNRPLARDRRLARRKIALRRRVKAFLRAATRRISMIL